MLSNPIDLSWCTKEQRFALQQVYRMWGKDKTEVLGKETVGTALMVRVYYQDGGKMTLGIEPDGYCHS